MAEAVTADAAGDEAYVTLVSVEAFPVDGGEAVFEPGTDYEEVFTYTSTDADNNRLVGLTRSAPIAHAAGVFVQAPAAETEDPSPTPASNEAQESAEPASETDQSADSTNASEAPPEVCEPLFGGRSCGEVIDDVSIPVDPCALAVDRPCGEVIDDFSIPDDPCLLVVNQTCSELIDNFSIPDDLCLLIVNQTCREVIDDVSIPVDPCDPDGTGQTCLAYIEGTLAPCDVTAETPYVGDLMLPPRNDVVIGPANGRCYSGPGSVVLVICLEYGVTPYLTVEQPPCSTWLSTMGRVDGYDWQPCRPGFWRTYAFVTVGGFVLGEDHSEPVQIQPEDCLRLTQGI